MGSIGKTVTSIAGALMAAALTLTAAADAGPGGGEGRAITWRLSADGEWLIGLAADARLDSPTPGPRLPRQPWPDERWAKRDGQSPMLVFRLGPSIAAEPGRDCGLPFWLAPDVTDACPDRVGAFPAPWGARLDWIGASGQVGLHADRRQAPLPIGGSLEAAAATSAGSFSWPLVVAAEPNDTLTVERFGIDGRVRIAGDLGLTWAMDRVRAEPIGPGRAFDRGFDQQSLSLGLSRGAWSGGLTGRLTRPRPAGSEAAGFGAIDLEVAWFTPWDGELSFGAENLILREPDPKDALPLPRPPQGPSRTPFVRYRQDF
jgi:hypothetical protein